MNKLGNKITVIIVMVTLLSASLFYFVNRALAFGASQNENEVIVSADNSNSSINESGSSTPIMTDKDETVYVNLNNNGTISKINVVNYFKANNTGIYQDYGNYDNIINLTNDTKPMIDGDSIKWQLTEPFEDFYYQGQLKDGELPWLFKIDYKLNGVSMDAGSLPGASGELVLTLKVEENKKAQEYFRQNYMMQITVPLNMQNTTLISAPDAVQMITGHTDTLAFTVLPQTTKQFEIKAGVKNFTMEGIDIAMMKADLSSYMDVEEMTKGFDSMSGGMDEMMNGTLQLKDGLSELSGGIDFVSEGINELSQGTPQLSEGMEQFNDGIKTFGESLDQLSTGSDQMKEGLQGLSDNGKQLLSGYQDIENGLSSVLSNKDQITLLAGEMAKSQDSQTAMLGQSILAQLEGLTQLQTGLDTLNTSLDQYTQGVTQAAGKYDTLNSGIHALPGGFDQLSGGFKQIEEGNKAVYSAVNDLNNGLSDINSAAAGIPDQVQKLADGQKSMKTGIDQAGKEIEDLTRTGLAQGDGKAVSFGAPGKVVPNSVQFVLRTPAIEKAVKPAENTETKAEEESFWDRLIRLFQ
jgi:X-X-X-Leu-X-X-Gly heptad repeat protein